MRKKCLNIFILLSIFLFFNITYGNFYVPNETITISSVVVDTFGNLIDTNCSISVLDKNLNLVLQDSMNKKNLMHYYSFTLSEYGDYIVIVKCKNQFGKDIFSYKKIRIVDYFSVLEEKIGELVHNASLNITLNITGNITEAVSQAQEDIIGLLLALHSTPETSFSCYNETHRIVYKTANWNINDKVYNITKTELEYCQYGCNNNTGECYGRPSEGLMSLFWIIIALVGGIILYSILR